jgi:hypothetical protein
MWVIYTLKAASLNLMLNVIRSQGILLEVKNLPTDTEQTQPYQVRLVLVNA